jgi:molybdopterin synthase catalytic subunit
MSIEIRLRYFAFVREQLGLETESLALAEGADVSSLYTTLAERHPVLGRVRKHLRIAVNRNFVDDDYVLQAGDEVALIPPVAGGSDRVRVTPEPLDADALASQVRLDQHGAVVTFVGVVRNNSQGKEVSSLEYEAFIEMATSKLAQIIDELSDRWPDCNGAVHHRVGQLKIGEAAVAIAVAAPHRKEAFLACEYAIDRIKQIVPIWKKEVGPDGDFWVGMGS